MAPYLSIIIPTYNEEKRLPGTLDFIFAFLRKQTYEAEIIVSDDGSRDRTVKIAAEKLRFSDSQVLVSPRNIGKGDAVRRGMLAAKGQYLLITDADLSTPIEEVRRFLRYLEAGDDIVIGSRALEDSKIEIHQSFYREIMGRVYNLIARAFSFKGIMDSQCGFKCFKSQVAKELFGLQKINGFSFDAEILFLAQKKGYKIREEPVIWRNSSQSRVQLIRDPIAMFFDLIKIRWIHRNLR
ncbi:MAG: Undecaprenyl-phosphate 4-deoxy-4-formamido-L-arabinose transferase [Candidatus Omnitrophica bacterium ADurb.Bin292]|jgi:dolichyl-phosphate beta-glucosyltransferase|nr:MAG: Undecaprenyl-phosphate 4-deoxy-4-formamido-L-arabinose transferase [Candidatus Omnitrophica bacterium ADurb.Bin292]HQB12652.1 glycosyltransferase family 2 protein [Candidatus Omnitrophota bacterium]